MNRATARLLKRAATSTLVLTLVASGVVLPRAAYAADPILASGFRDDIVKSGLSLPTTVQFAPNGELFVAEKSGIIKRFTSLADSTPDITADLRTQVYNYWDKGMLGMAVDPQYPTRPYVYALFSYDAMIGGTAPKWGSTTNGGNDTCYGDPNGPGSTTDGCVSSGRLVRLTVGTNGVSTAQRVLVEDWCGQFPSHSIGTVTFGPDGYLYAGAGEGASFATINLDYGQFGGTVINSSTGQPYTPKNPCGDPPGGVGGSMTIPTAEGGSLRAQDKRTTGDPTALNGTIIRIDPDTGLAVSTNPSYAAGRDENDRRIIAYGLRNPYRFTFKPGTSEIWIGDVGASTWEEFNRIVSPTNAIRNFGWPCYEGSARNSAWDSLNINMCENLYAAGTSAVQAPYTSYRHGQGVFSGDPCPTGGGVISGIRFYAGGDYPSRLDNALFFTDFARGCIWAMRAGTNGLPDASQVEVIEQNAAGPVDLVSGPNGDIFYVDLDGGAIHRLVYSGSNTPPTVVATATPTSGPAPLAVSFNASGSSDPDGDSITFAWDLDGDGAYDDANGATTSRTYAEGTWTPGVRVTDSKGAASTKGFTINAGNSPPMPVIDTPTAGTTWSAGQNISFSGRATDPDDGTLAASRLTWRVVLKHCAPEDPNACHEHIVQDFAGVASGSFQAPDHELPSYLELRLTATDSDGLAATVSRTLQPKTVNLTFATSPSGLTLNVGGASGTAPFTRQYIVNSSISLDAPTPQSKDGLSWAYASWSDGGSRNHTITAPASNTTYTATYTTSSAPDARDKCANATTASAQNTWLYNTLYSTSDVDWYLFNLTSSGRVMVTLGGLPQNYRLDLYSSCSTQIASSNRSGTEFEQLYVQLSAGSYRVRVTPSSGGVNTSVPYGVRFQPLASGVQVLSSTGWTDASGNLVISGEILNNTATRYRLNQITATFYNSSGATLGTATAWADVNVMANRSRSPFRISVAKPSGYSRYTVAVTYSQATTDSVIQNFPVSSPSQGTSGGPWFRGNFTNNNGFNVSWTKTATALFDTWGTVINTSVDWTSPTSIAAGGTGSYNVSFSQNYTGWNRASVIIQASKQTTTAARAQ